MRIFADLHIHSRFSRGTSSHLTLPHLDHWARIKGLNLVGTGDCTHPQWLPELREQFSDAGDGLYTLKESCRRDFIKTAVPAEELPIPSATVPWFVLTGEISTIYKKNGRTRKIHHIVILSSFERAAAFQSRLAHIGNISSDGRPILGIDSRDLLELLLDSDPCGILIPAHIWTPWFSVLGAQSGFDSIDECYADLAHHVTAIETGLSSNPPMNWAVPSLARFAIVSNSDAHSPENLAREATIFDIEMTFAGLAGALRGSGVMGTVEFFPQEGKYHCDGHRKCGVFLRPETAAHTDLCPRCGKPFTHGVMSRVMELAGSVPDETAPCPQPIAGNKRPYYSLVGLSKILAEILKCGSTAKKTRLAYNALIETGYSELSLLMDTPIDEIERINSLASLSGELLAEAIGRMRRGEVSIRPGYDGEYGKVSILTH